MPATDLGTKYTCFKCGTKFYDLKKPEPVCPKCGADQRESPALKPSPAAERRPRPRPPEPKPPEVEVEPEADEDADEAVEEDEESTEEDDA
jgi:uncharacterized protein (TIGR02300 family)